MIGQTTAEARYTVVRVSIPNRGSPAAEPDQFAAAASSSNWARSCAGCPYGQLSPSAKVTDTPLGRLTGDTDLDLCSLAPCRPQPEGARYQLRPLLHAEDAQFSEARQV